MIPEVLALLVPPGAVNTKSKSGTPDILAVNAIEPCDRADMGRPEGAKITDRFSMISTYNSLEVCRTLDLRHGIAGPTGGEAVPRRLEEKLLDGPRAGEALQESATSQFAKQSSEYTRAVLRA